MRTIARAFSPAIVIVLVAAVLLSVAISMVVAGRERDRVDARVRGELRYATAALPRALHSTEALLFALDSPLGAADDAQVRLTGTDLQRLDPSLRALVRFEPRGGRGPAITQVLPRDLIGDLRAINGVRRDAIRTTLRRADRRLGVALSRPVDSPLGRLLLVALAVRPAPGGGADDEAHWSAAVLGLDAFLAEAFEGIGGDLALRVRARRDDAPAAPVATYAPGGPVDERIFDTAPSRVVSVGDRSWVVHAAATERPAPFSLPVLLGGLVASGLVLALLLAARRGEGRARTLAAQMTAGLRERTRQMETLTENAPDLIGRFDRDHRLVFANSALQKATRLKVGERILDVASRDPRAAALADHVDRQVTLALSTGRPRQVEFSLGDGPPRDFETHFVPEFGDDGEVVYVLAVARDVTERARAQREMARRALRDPLTGLANRALVDDRLEHALARRGPGLVALLVIDIDRFKPINDSFGHVVGDSVLTEVGRRLLPLLRDEDTLGRLGGDEFVVVAELRERADAERLAERVVEAMRPPLELAGRLLTVTASVGVIAAEGRAERPQELMRAADAAMYQAKNRGGDGYAVFDQSMRSLAHDRLTLELEIRRGIDGGEFVAYYQPLLCAGDRRVIGFEALARWHRADGGIAGPAQFIHAAEESGLITDLGSAIIRLAARQAVTWKVADHHLRLWINLSPRQLARPDVLDCILAIVAEEGASCEMLGFELTETTVAQGPQHIRETLAALRSRGARIAIDDFGVGYSSLSRIKELPIDDIKIDRSFVAGVGTDPNDTALTEAVIRLARARGARTVAEGIETEEQADRLSRLGCDVLQGYLFGRPVEPTSIAVPMLGPVTP